jgi:type II secretory pathway pseudopilin PulG
MLDISRGARRSDGVSFPELLVVILLATILAALLIPALLSQKTKSTDAQAKELVRTAQTTAESIATDNDGNYEKVSPAELHVIEPAIVTGKGVPAKNAWLTHASGTSSYKVTATASSGDTFTIERNKDEITRSCTQVSGNQGCPTGSW